MLLSQSCHVHHQEACCLLYTSSSSSSVSFVRLFFVFLLHHYWRLASFELFVDNTTVLSKPYRSEVSPMHVHPPQYAVPQSVLACSWHWTREHYILLFQNECAVFNNSTVALFGSISDERWANEDVKKEVESSQQQLVYYSWWWWDDEGWTLTLTWIWTESQTKNGGLYLEGFIEGIE